jgi:hypothetical protein
MTEFDEDLIWDTIMEHGRTRIDHVAFAAFFPFNADNFLSSIIYGFAMERPVATIAGNIAAQVSQTGNVVDLPALTAFVEGSREALRTETDLTRMALRELARGEDSELIFKSVQQGLDA